jgi:hypothetical protein
VAEKDLASAKQEIKRMKLEKSLRDNQNTMDQAAAASKAADAMGVDPMSAILGAFGGGAGLAGKKKGAAPMMPSMLNVPIQGLAGLAAGGSASSLQMLPNGPVAFGQLLGMNQMFSTSSENDALRAAQAEKQAAAAQQLAQTQRVQDQQHHAAQAQEMMSFAERMATMATKAMVPTASAVVGGGR